MRNFLKKFDNAFKIIKLIIALNAKNSKKMLENATIRLNIQRFKSLKNIKIFKKNVREYVIKIKCLC